MKKLATKSDLKKLRKEDIKQDKKMREADIKQDRKLVAKMKKGKK
jgi:predicted transcriptional regulator